jgi:hypothetical protein
LSGQNPHIYWQAFRVFCRRLACPGRQEIIIAEAINSQSKMRGLWNPSLPPKLGLHRHLTYVEKEGISNLKPIKSISEIFALEIVVLELVLRLPLPPGAAAEPYPGGKSHASRRGAYTTP